MFDSTVADTAGTAPCGKPTRRGHIRVCLEPGRTPRFFNRWDAARPCPRRAYGLRGKAGRRTACGFWPGLRECMPTTYALHATRTHCCLLWFHGQAGSALPARPALAGRLGCRGCCSRARDFLKNVGFCRGGKCGGRIFDRLFVGERRLTTIVKGPRTLAWCSGPLRRKQPTTPASFSTPRIRRGFARSEGRCRGAWRRPGFFPG